MQKPKILIKIAQRVRQLRKIHKLSQEKLAEKAGLHPTFIGNIERAEKNPTITTLEKIAQAFKITLSELLIFSDDQKLESADAQTLNNALKLLEIARDLADTYKISKKK
jgi:transcriptional regulator with XRE-family HTH domain